ncbi:MAG: DUF1499 domain-containing protein [Cellvibrionaceae bacterium]
MTKDMVWTAWLFRIQLVLIAVMVIGLLGNKFSFLPFKLAFYGFGLSLLCIVALGVIALLGVLLSFIVGSSAWRGPGLLALVVGLLPLVIIVLVVGAKNFGVPAIHDITTDLENPPQYSAAISARGEGSNSLARENNDLAKLQQKAYPDVKPLLSTLSSAEAYQKSLATVKTLGWEILSENESAGTIEAFDETAFFGFKDDVVIRVTATPEGSRIDMRSVSRVGQSDLGANAKRIKTFQEAFLK